MNKAKTAEQGQENQHRRPAINPVTVKRLLSYLSAYKGIMVFVVLCILVAAIASVGSSLFIQALIDDYIVPLVGIANPDFTGLVQAIIAMACLYALGTLAAWLYNRYMVTVAQKILKDIRDEMFEKMQFLPIGYFDSHTHGDVMSHYTNDTDTLRQMLAQGLPQLISSAFNLTAVFVAMLYLSIPLTLVVVITLVVIMLIVGRIANKSGAYFVRQQMTLGDLNGYIEEMINGQKVVKVFCHEEKAEEIFRRKNESLRQNTAAANGAANVMMPIMGFMGYLLYVLLSLVGGWMAIAALPNLTIFGFNTMTLGSIAAFLTLSRSFIGPLSQVANLFNAMVMALAGATRIFALMDQKPEDDSGFVTLVNANEAEDGALIEADRKTGVWAWKQPLEDGTVRYTKLQGNVVFDDVDFGYTPEKMVLHNITLYAKPGQKVAFVGATGAGKTTITNLINRFYDIADGKIRYDGININKIKKADLRRSLGVVLQDVNLFTGTVMENIRYGNPEASDEECVAAAKLVCAHNFITMLPQGYETVLEGDGSGLSQGQRQLLSIARAAVSNPPVMILDEATSSIDTRTEALVQRGMDRLMEGRTVFVIAHRLSTVQNSNVIMVLDSGRIIERGSHEELIEKGGTYYQLYTGAFELE